MLRKIILTILFIGAMLLAAYLFVWLFLLLLIAIPIIYLWLRWKVRKAGNTLQRKRSAMVMENHERDI
ncbi:MAG: hypothetical protein V1778_01355 [bacterium]